MVLRSTGQAPQPAVTPSPSAASNQSFTAPLAAKDRHDIAPTAAAYRIDAPRRRNELGQALPFRQGRCEYQSAEAFRRARVGETIVLELFPDARLTARVTRRGSDADSAWVAAQLDNQGPRDRFFMSWYKTGARGLVELPSRNVAYEILAAADGGYEVKEWLFTDVVCASPSGSSDAAQSGVPRPAPPTAQPSAAEIDAGQVPVLQSRPGVQRVIYLDFDGETVSNSAWSGGTIVAPSARMSSSQVRETWQRVCRDFDPFEVNVTTVRADYDAAPINRKIHCVITDNDEAAPGAGGVAYIGVFDVADPTRKICWAFVDSDAKDCAEVISHEVGHTLGLQHDGRSASGSDPREEYYAGHGSGETGWAPIMGIGYYRNLTQWSRGEYARANNTEDDLAIMSISTRTPYLTDDHADSLGPAAFAVNGDRADGVVGRNSDVDFFRVNLGTGNYSIVLQPAAHTDLDTELRVLDASGALLTSSNPVGQLSAVATFSVASSQTIYLRVSGVGEGSVLGTGYSNYASLGSYSLTGFGSQEQPPSPPVGLSTRRISGTQTEVSWMPNPSASSYQVYRNGNVIGTVTGTTFLDTSTQPSTEYAYTIVAINQYGSSSASETSFVTSPAFDEFIMDGDPDFSGYLISNPGMVIYAAVRGTKLYVATWSPGDNNSGFGSDHHLLVSDTLLASATTPAPWAKRGTIAIPGNKPYLAGESVSTYAGWFNTRGSTSLFKAPINAGVMEGVIDLVAEFGSVPANLYVAAIAYQTDDANAADASRGSVRSQAPAGNGDDNLDPAEFLRVPMRSVADARQNGIYDILAPDRAFSVREMRIDSPQQVLLRWPSVPGRAYRVERCADLLGSWQLLPPSPVTASPGQWEMEFIDTSAGSGARFFFRIVAP